MKNVRQSFWLVLSSSCNRLILVGRLERKLLQIVLANQALFVYIPSPVATRKPFPSWQTDPCFVKSLKTTRVGK